jgi:hypothetical protein
VSDRGRGLFSFEFPAQIETSASREHNIIIVLTIIEKKINAEQTERN